MKIKKVMLSLFLGTSLMSSSIDAQIGTRFSSERKVVTDPITGTELIFLTSTPAVDPTLNHDGTKIQIQSAMLSEDGKSMNIYVVPLPEEWLQSRKN